MKTVYPNQQITHPVEAFGAGGVPLVAVLSAATMTIAGQTVAAQVQAQNLVATSPASTALGNTTLRFDWTQIVNGVPSAEFSAEAVTVISGVPSLPLPLVTGDENVICDLAGVDASDWPLTRLEELPFLPTALSEAKRRVPCEWTTLDALSQQSLRLALLYQAAAQVVPAANPGRTEDFKIGAFALKTDDTGLLADVGELYSYAALYFAEVVLPIGVIPVARPDVFVRPMIRKSKITGSRRIY